MPRMHEEQMHIEPGRQLRGDHLPAGTSGELAALRARDQEPGHSPDLSRQAAPTPRRDAHRTHRRLPDAAPDPLTPEELYHSLLYAGFYVKGVAQIGAQWATRQSQWPNVFTDEAELHETSKFKDPQIKWHQAYFDLAEDEALVVEVTPRSATTG